MIFLFVVILDITLQIRKYHTADTKTFLMFFFLIFAPLGAPAPFEPPLTRSRVVVSPCAFVSMIN